MENKRKQRRVAIFWDIENLVFAARRDKIVRGHSIEEVIRNIAIQLDDIARQYGVVVKRFGALSLPPASSYQKSYYLRRSVMRTVAILQRVTAEWNCPIVFVPHSANAADNIIVEIAISFAKRNKADVFLVATGDGQEPFPTLLKHLQDANKLVHVAAYSYVPARIKNFGIKYSFISGGVRSGLASKEGKRNMIPERPLTVNEETGSKPEIGGTVPVCTAGSGVAVETKNALHDGENGSGEENKSMTTAENISESVLNFVKKQYEAIPPRHANWIQKALNAFLTVSNGAAWRVEFEDILNVLRYNAVHWQGPPTDEEIATLLKALIRFGDLFEDKPLYVFNHSSELLQRDFSLEIKPEAR